MLVNFELTGVTPLLWHADNVEAADEIKEWQKAKENKDASVKGDDRSPPWIWIKYLNHDGVNLALPQENLMATIRAAGAKIAIPTSKRSENFKKLSQSGLMTDSEYCRFLSGGKQVSIKDIYKFKDRPFSEHKKAVAAMGFELSVKRARVGQAKHVRVRAKFDEWSVLGTLAVAEPLITFQILEEMFFIAGDKVGLCDWRPGSPSSPGPFGRFTSTLKQVSR
jgi:hypothetical protein